MIIRFYTFREGEFRCLPETKEYPTTLGMEFIQAQALSYCKWKKYAGYSMHDEQGQLGPIHPSTSLEAYLEWHNA
jgi:hypothetical protein